MLSQLLETRLIRLLHALVDQQRARIIIPAQHPESGFWFGGGNMVADAAGTFYLVGRYRNRGDSRSGVAAGERGLELAIFRSTNRGESFDKWFSFSKQDFDLPGKQVVSIEGSALDFDEDWVDLYVSTEKAGIGYPRGYEGYLKPGTGVWSIDRISAPTLGELKTAVVEPVLHCSDPRYVHVKDPFVYTGEPHRRTLFFCSHPFSWTSSNTGHVSLEGTHGIQSPTYEFFPRGVTWDVAITRGTCILDVPAVGRFQDIHASILFYDGGECVRNLDEHSQAVKRPRGYSCEELGGAAYFLNRDWSRVERLSKYEPLFISPHGTGCSRYVDVLTQPEGMYVTWQQSQSDGSQPLVMNFVPIEEIRSILE